LARDAGVLHGAAHAALVLVAGRGVDVPVPGLDGLDHDVRGDVVLDLPHAVAELGDGRAVMEGQSGNSGHARASSGCVSPSSLWRRPTARQTSSVRSVPPAWSPSAA